MTVAVPPLAIPVSVPIMLSSEAANLHIDKARELGADGYVFKPVTMEELEEVLKQAETKRKLKTL